MSAIADRDWPEGWGEMEADQAAFFTRQLALELPPDHPVQARIRDGSCRAIGKFWGSDDTVYAIGGWQAPYFVAHLAFPPADTRPWLVRRLRPKPAPRGYPALLPLVSIAALGAYFD